MAPRQNPKRIDGAVNNAGVTRGCSFGHADWGKRSPDWYEEHFLRGPGRWLQDAWRTVRILGEFPRGFRAFRSLPPAITVFGSARIGEGSGYYDLARDLGRALARDGFAVMTGGGPGLGHLPLTDDVAAVVDCMRQCAVRRFGVPPSLLEQGGDAAERPPTSLFS